MKERTRLAYDVQLSPHFAEHEFACTCRGIFCHGIPLEGIDPKLPILLEAIRDLAGEPIIINSGYRCPDRNLLPKKDGGVDGARTSQHMLGTAADIVIPGMSPDAVYDFVLTAISQLRVINPQFAGLGFGLGEYHSFTHVDVRRNRARW